MLPPEKHTFDTIWGHEAARKVVPRLLGLGRLPHALLLTGQDAIGKRSLAFAMAKAILSAGRHPDEGSMAAAAPAPAKRKLPDEDPEPQEDLFGDASPEEEPDLFGDMFAEEPVASEPAPEPPPPAPPAEPEPEPDFAKEESAAAAEPPPEPDPKPEKTAKKPQKKKGATTEARVVPRATFVGYDPRVCRLVEASYPVSYSSDGRPSNSACMDLTIIEPAGNRRGVVVDQIRYLQEIGNLPPVEGSFRVALIFGADTITAEGGNSILKLLEEPPRYLVLILVADRLNQVLPTIKSRCTVMPLSPLPRQDLVDLLVEKEGLELEAAKVAASLSEGRPGIALQAIEANLLKTRREVFEARLQLDRFGETALAASAARVQASGNLEQGLWLLLSFARDRLVQAVAPDAPELLVHADAFDLIDAVKADPERISDEADRLIDSYDLLAHPFLPNQRAALQLALWPD